MSVLYIPSYNPLLYSKTGVFEVYLLFLLLTQNRLWVLTTASVEQNMENIFFSISAAFENRCVFHKVNKVSYPSLSVSLPLYHISTNREKGDTSNGMKKIKQLQVEASTSRSKD